ncbi:predicted permease [Vibrio sp. JCM 19236]|nr:predicted permease [Vibrio sp. JCM 19236]
MDILLLFIAGLLGGALNSIAGGGTFITFPALVFAGVPPIAANATNTFSSFAGYLSGAYAFRAEMASHKKTAVLIAIASLVGGSIGAYLLLNIEEREFNNVIPWLMLFATLMFIYGSQIGGYLKKLSTKSSKTEYMWLAFLGILFLLVAIYGGFFNAGLGIITLSYLVLAGFNNINLMNGLKLLVSCFVSIIAIAIFIANDLIAWYEGTVVMLGALVGGYYSAILSTRLSQATIRKVVIVISVGTTAYFFVQAISDLI